MVINSATLGRSGVHDFVLIRVSAVVITLYTFYLFHFILTYDLTFNLWSSFFHLISTKIFTMVTLFCVLTHTWIGLWQVLSDYVKCAFVRGVSQAVLVVVLLTYFFGGLFILWGA